MSVILLGRDGAVRSNDDLVFYNQPTALAGAVHLRDKIRPDDDGTVSIDVVTLELDDVPEDVDRIVIGASLEPAAGVRFGEAGHIRMTLHRSSDADALVVFTVDDASTELALVVGEFYRRAEVWRFRAIGQGYEGGLATLIADFGVDVDPVETHPTEAGSGADARLGDSPTAVTGLPGPAEAAGGPVPENPAARTPHRPLRRPSRRCSIISRPPNLTSLLASRVLYGRHGYRCGGRRLRR